MQPYLPFRNQIKRARAAFHTVAPSFARHRARLVVGFFCLFTVDALQLVIPRVTRHAVDGLASGAITRTGLLATGGLIVALALSIGLFRFFWRYCILGFSRFLEQEVRERLLAHTLHLDRAFYQTRTAGDIMALATNDLTAVQMAGGMGLVAGSDAVFMGIATLAFMAYIHPLLTLIAIVPMPLLVFLSSLLTARLHERFLKVQERFSELTEFARGSLSGIRLIKAYTQENAQCERFDALGESYVRENLRLAVVNGVLWPFSGYTAGLSLLAVVFYGGRLTIDGSITIGDFVAFTSYLAMLTWPMMALGWVANLLQRGLTSLERLNGIFAAQPLLTDPTVPAVLPSSADTLEVRDLTFAYPGQKTPTLRKVNLSVGPGLLGVVGRTGSGKSTLAQVLARLYPVPDNTLFLAGSDANRLRLDDWRSAIAYVPQESMLFADTLSANIALGKKDATGEEIEAAARAAMIHEEILAMPQGYASRLGERGVQLSGGQRQRVALARALLLDRAIVIIDDGLSAVDMETEHAIIGQLRTALAGRTCIFISHRLAPLAEADRIIVMENGAIVAAGDHTALMTTNEFYRTIFTHQHDDTCLEEGA